jgi:uncharacterized protein (TIGR03435 family)
VLTTKDTKITARRSRNQGRAVIKILCLLVPLTRLGIVCQKNKLWHVSVTKGVRLALSIFVFFVVFVVQIGAAGQQLPAARLSFEVASVKRSPDPRSVPIFNPVVAEVQPGGVWRSTFATVFGLLRTLYPGHLLPGQIVGPEWIGTEFYDINARGPVSASADDLREMARTLLADRFKLVLHTEKRQVIAYRLVTARADGRLGPGLSMPSIDCAAYRAAKEKGAPLPVDPKRRPFGDRMPCVSTVMPVFDQTRVVPGAEMRITAGGATIASIIPILSRELDRPLVDATGLTQVFDIELQYSLGVPRPDAEPGPPLRSALADQLGLRVQDSVTVVDVLVIDRIERPTPD